MCLQSYHTAAGNLAHSHHLVGSDPLKILLNLLAVACRHILRPFWGGHAFKVEGMLEMSRSADRQVCEGKPGEGRMCKGEGWA